jgi:hypothetical protein
MKTSTLILGGLAIAGVYMLHQHSAAAAPATTSGMDGLGALLRGEPGRPVFTAFPQRGNPSAAAETAIRKEVRAWLSKMGGAGGVARSKAGSVRTLGSFYGAHSQAYWPWIDIEMRAAGFAPNLIQYAKWSLNIPAPRP